MVVSALAESLDKPFAWAVGFFFGNTELSLELWNVIAGLSSAEYGAEKLKIKTALKNELI